MSCGGDLAGRGIPDDGQRLFPASDRHWPGSGGQIYEKHRFFTERLIAAGVDPKTAEADACRIEHVISDESFQKLKKQLM